MDQKTQAALQNENSTASANGDHEYSASENSTGTFSSESSSSEMMDMFFSDPPPIPPAKTFFGRFRQSTFRFFDDANSSRPAFAFSVYFIVLIVFSTLTFCLETMDSLSETDEQMHAWNVMEVFVIAQFTSDYLIRISTCPSVPKFVIAPLNLIDIIAIIPFWIELGIYLASSSKSAASGLAVVRVLRLARVLRLFKLAKNSQQLKLVSVALYRSRDGIFLLLFLLTLAIIFFSSAMYYSETAYCYLDDDSGLWIYDNSTTLAGDPSFFQSIISTFWWCIVTMATVGYGDTYPITPPGKIVATFTMVSGLLVIAFPITIIGANLNEVYDQFKRAKAAKELRKQQKRQIKNRANSKKLQEIQLESNQPSALARALGEAYLELDSAVSTIDERLASLKSTRQALEALEKGLAKHAQEANPESARLPTSPRANVTTAQSSTRASFSEEVRD